MDIEDFKQFLSSLDKLQLGREPMTRSLKGKQITQQDIDSAFDLGETLVLMRMTIQNMIRSLTTFFPVELSILLRRVTSTTCLEQLEFIFNEMDDDVDLPDGGEGDLAELLETFPRMSVEDDRV